MTASPVPKDDEAVARAMRLRPAPPQVMRLSRKALWLGGGLLGCAGVGLLIFALRDVDGGPPPELYRAAAAPPDAVNALPADYTGPRLGAPLPGDLGRPILQARLAEEAAEYAPGAPTASEGPEAAEAARAEAAEQRRRERDAARTSGLFLQGAGMRATRADPTATGDEPAAPVSATPSIPSAPSARSTPGALWAGSIISGALTTGLRSDLPGAVLGQVTEDVFDSRTGQVLVIPKGSRLVGTSDAQIAQGQSRVRILWSRLILPDGRAAALGGATASDPQGFAGLEDRVDNRWPERWRAAGLTTLLAISAAAADGDETDRLARAIHDGVGSGVDQTGRDVLAQGMAIPPRLTVRPGFAFRIILTEDLILGDLSGD